MCLLMDKDKIYLLIASSVMVFLGCLRSWFSVTTGYLLPDEGLYYHATLGNFYIRPLYTLLLTVFKKVFFVESVFDSKPEASIPDGAERN